MKFFIFSDVPHTHPLESGSEYSFSSFDMLSQQESLLRIGKVEILRDFVGRSKLLHPR